MRRLCVLLVIALACPPIARADTVAFDYAWKLSPSYYSAATYGYGSGNSVSVSLNLDVSTSEDGQSMALLYNGNRLDLTLASPGSASAMTGEWGWFGSPTQIPFGTLTLASTPGPGGMYVSAGFLATLTLTDRATGMSADIPFSGDVWSEVMTDGTGIAAVSLYSYWSDPYQFARQIGDSYYFTDNAAWWNLPNEYGELSLLATADISVADATPATDPPWDPDTGPADIPLAQAPEPSALALGGSALLLLGLARLRRHRTPGN